MLRKGTASGTQDGVSAKSQSTAGNAYASRKVLRAMGLASDSDLQPASDLWYSAAAAA